MRPEGTFLGTASIYLTFCLVAFLLARSQIDSRPVCFQSLDLSLPLYVVLLVRGNAGGPPGAGSAPRDGPSCGPGDRSSGVTRRRVSRLSVSLRFGL